MDDLEARILTAEHKVSKLYQAPTIPIYDTTNLPQDAVEGQIAIGLDGSFNWYSNGNWHTQPGFPTGVNSVPQDVVDGQVAIGTDGGFYWCTDGQWYTAPFRPSIDINSPQDVVSGQVAVGFDGSFHWSPDGRQSFVPIVIKQTDVYRTRLYAGSPPGVPIPQTLYIQCRKRHFGDSGILRVQLYQATTLIETYDITLTDTFALNSHNIINYAAITDWSDIEVAIRGISDDNYELTCEVSWIDFDIPST